MNLLKKIKRTIIRRLAQELREEENANRMSQHLLLKSGAGLGPESAIENLSPNKDAITIGENSYVRGHLFVFANGGSIKMGSWCYVGARTEIWSMASVEIGDRVLIAHNVNITDSSGHSKDAKQRHAQFRAIVTTGHPPNSAELPGITFKPIVIEDDVWISCGVTILPGVRIGARSVIAAGAMITKDVPPDTIYKNDFKAVSTALVK